MKIIAVCILSGFLCAGCVSANKYRLKAAEAEKYRALSEQLNSRLAKVTAEKNKLETTNKILNDALSDASTPSKLSLEEAIKIWKRALEKLPAP